MSNYRVFKYLFCLIFLVLIINISGCNNQVKEQIVEDENYYKIYYVNNLEDKLVSEDYFAKEDKTDKLVKELIGRLTSIPDGITLKKPIPDEVKIKDIKIKDDCVTINFSETYKQITGISEILRRACVVKTLCQIDGINKVEYTIEDQPLMYSELNPVGAMSADDFIDNTGGETTYYQNVQVSLYYTDLEGKKLFQTRHNVEFDGTISLEELVVRQLLAGPLEDDKLSPVLPAGTKINKVSLKDGICYVDFSKEFLEGRDGVSDDVIVYSVVNSLSDIGNVSKVQFWIDGKPVSSYRETVQIDLPIERKFDIIAED
ncbi:GerMN domain-containing protein [Catonella morbi]|uniref:GerMN domain-containing protein n=1 Tax=Catonella morbi TaxID=43997 RepID=UPI00055999EA|nr:GerMN domain-containing protein [Catonella morbi]